MPAAADADSRRTRQHEVRHNPCVSFTRDGRPLCSPHHLSPSCHRPPKPRTMPAHSSFGQPERGKGTRRVLVYSWSTLRAKGACSANRVGRRAEAHLFFVRLQRVQRHRRAHIPHFRLTVQGAREQMERRLRRPGQARNPASVRARGAAQGLSLHRRLGCTWIPEPHPPILVPGGCVIPPPPHTHAHAQSWSIALQITVSSRYERACAAGVRHIKSHKYLVEHPRPQGRSGHRPQEHLAS
jgi:hypothetical protein